MYKVLENRNSNSLKNKLEYDISKKQIHQDELEKYVVELPCGHKFNTEFYAMSTVRQVVIHQHPYCIECREEYKSNQSEIIKGLYDNIQDEKKQFKNDRTIRNLNQEEKDNLKFLRKDFYLNKLKKNKPNTDYIDLIINMFEILFDTIYFI